MSPFSKNTEVKRNANKTERKAELAAAVTRAGRRSLICVYCAARNQLSSSHQCAEHGDVHHRPANLLRPINSSCGELWEVIKCFRRHSLTREDPENRERKRERYRETLLVFYLISRTINQSVGTRPHILLLVCFPESLINLND